VRGYELHPKVEDDFDDLFAFIGQRSETAAENVYFAIHDALARLVPLPGRGHRRPDLTDRPLRFISVHDYLVAYAEEKPLWVIAILHGRREPQVLASILRARQ
jgi:plasmid stabilization system protein ParE